MATIKKFEDIEAWQLARKLCDKINTVSVETKLNKDFRLRDQINAASGSNGEVKSQLYRLLDRKYISEELFEELYKITGEIGNKIGAWMNYLNKTELRGTKFKNRT